MALSTRTFLTIGVLILAPAFLTSPSPAQGQAPVVGPPGPGGGPRAAQLPPVNPASNPLFRGLRWREIGPITMGGRVDEIAVVESDPRVFYVGFATGGLWKTVNAGTTFHPVFDSYGTSSIGSVAVSQSNPELVWVGTGEANNRQSSSFGDGVYRSTDGGETFTHVGLRETESIHRVILHPTDPDIVYVAAVGHLFEPNRERGVFRTTDGGRTWEHVLFVDEDTGATDLVMHPEDPDVLFAATYQRRRTRWGFNGGGPGSGIWRSDDGGDSWTRLEGNGLPEGTMGRIGLDIARSNPNVIYALIEVAADRAEAGEMDPDPEKTGLWRSTDGGRTWAFRSNHNNRPMYYSLIRVDPNDAEVVYTGGSSFSRSEDGGVTFDAVPGASFVHVDHHSAWIDPANSDHIIIGSFDESWDRGETFESFRTMSVAQFYQVSVDTRRPYHVCGGLQDNGSWCGPSAVRGLFIPDDAWYRVGGGDGTYSAVDPTDPDIVYSASQFGNMRRSDLGQGEIMGMAAERVDATYLGGTPIRPTPPGEDDPTTNVVPTPEAGEIYRWNWSTPFMLSPHNPNTLYTGGNRLFKSVDRGETWTTGPDLTRDLDPDQLEIMGVPGARPPCGDVRGEPCILSKNDGVSFYGTITTLDESPLTPGVLWVGTDDGNVQVSQDDNRTWTEVSANVRGDGADCWVSRVEASHFDPATAYVAFDCHRSGDLRPHLYVTRDFGTSWTAIDGGLPEFGNINVVQQDPRNRDLLYVGTEFGFFVSLDEGRSWSELMTGLPTVRVDDVVVHPRDGDLVLGTHGRGALVLDDVTHLQQLTSEVLESEAHLFQPREAVLWRVDGTLARGSNGVKHFYGRNPEPGTALSYYLRDAGPEAAVLTITDVVTGEVFRRMEGPAEAGLNRVQWDLRGDAPEVAPGERPGAPPMAVPGVYRITLQLGDVDLTRTVRVLEDVWMGGGR